MDIATFANIFVPLSAAVTCFVIVSLYLFYYRYNGRITPARILLYYFGCCIVNWSSVYAYFYCPSIFVALNSFVLFTFIMAQILFYKFLFYLTRTNPSERFSRIHLLLPILIAVFLTILMLITPFELQLLSILGRGKFNGGSYLFFLVSNSKMPIRFIFSVVYTVLCFIRLYKYRNQVDNYSANYDKSSLGWVKTYLLLALSLIPIPLIGMLLPRDMAVGSSLLTVQCLVIVFQYSFLCFHTIIHNYISFDDTDSKCELGDLCVEESQESCLAEPSSKVNITKAEFEEYMVKKRPFLNSDLKLVDLAGQLNTNRTYLSSFINSAYGMNFSRLVNHFRLMELKRLKQLKSMEGRTEKELAEMVGFGSYRNFKRFVAQDDC